METQALTTLPTTISYDIFDSNSNEDQMDNSISESSDLLLADEGNNIPIRVRPWAEIEPIIDIETTTRTTRISPPDPIKIITPKPTKITTTQKPTTSLKTTTTKATTTTTTTSQRPTTTTKKPTTTAVDLAAKLPRLRTSSWTRDTDLKMWVLLTRDGRYLVAMPGRTPKRMTKQQYIDLRRKKMTPSTTTTTTTTSRPTQARTTISRGDRMKADDPAIQSSGIVLDRPEAETTDRSADIQMQVEDETKDGIDKDVEEMLEEKDDENNLTNNRGTLQNQEGNSNIYRNETITNQRIHPVTRLPITTTVRTTTTTTTTPAPRPTTAYRNGRETTALIRADDLPNFIVNTWTMDYDVKLWVLKLQDGTFMVSKPGQTPRKTTREEFIDMRQAILAQTSTTPSTTIRYRNRQTTAASRPIEMEADAPVAQRMTLTNNRDLTLHNVQEGGSLSNSQITLAGRNSGRNQEHSNISVDTILSGHVNGHHRHRHGHGNDAHHTRQKKIEMRVSGGRTSRDGRIEVLPPGESDWGVICGDFWTFKEAMVSCRHFGLGYAQQAAKTIHYGGKYQKKYYSAVRCHGSEKRLDDCQWEDHNGLIQCTRSEAVAAIVCSEKLPDLEPSTYMVESTSYLRDHHMYYLECAMEENCLAPSAYDIRKNSRQWRTSTRRLLRFSSVVKNIGTADFRPKSRRSDWEWHACHMHYHSMEVFAHYDIVDKYGNRVAEGLKASFCLEDSACDRGVYPKYDCQHYGEQGISVGCSDNYMADIDCQWIDITDLKPGNYFFKLAVNPKMLVPEITYDNNGMSCDLHYTGYYARITNCKLQSIL